MAKKRLLILLIFNTALNAALMQAQSIKYAPAWFGPNANPVPEMTDARIPSKTTVSLMGDYYVGYGEFGNGDKTTNGYIKIELPLLPERVSVKIWTSTLEYFTVSQQLSNKRGMNGHLTGMPNGDLYVQTRISLLKERKKLPEIIINSTLKTASAKTVSTRRYFDTPGYYFDMEVGKSFYIKSKFISEIRTVENVGFMSWETTGSRQNDAPMYGAKLIIGNEKWKLDNTLSGYWGWMHTSAQYGSDYGDTPLVYTAKFSILAGYMDYFAQYLYGIKDFPYQQIRLGISFPVEKLTPKYK